MYQIEKLPDYVETDTGMIPVESSAPAVFSNRYAGRNLSVEERYGRTQEMKTFKITCACVNVVNNNPKKIIQLLISSLI